MAVVYFARQADLDRPVALKELAGIHASDPAAAKRFLHEAQLAGSLNHPNIVTVYGYFEHDGIPYIAMEFLPRGSLRPLVGGLTVPQIVGALVGILDGLAHAGERGIVHRDLKPENVMRTDNGHVKIADFGIAKAHDELGMANLTPVGEFLGSPAYVSPEQALGAPATAASDLYAVGVMAFELFSGSVPFADPSPTALLIRKVNERAPSLRSLAPEVDKKLADWVDSLLGREPERRPSSPRVVRESLEEAVEHACGPRWWRDAALPAGEPVPERPRTVPAVPQQFVSTGTLAARSALGPLVVNALKRPGNWLAGAAVAIAAAVMTPWIFRPWLYAAAVLVYLASSAITFFDEAEAARFVERSAR